MPITYKEEETTEGNEGGKKKCKIFMHVIMQKLETTTLEGDGKHKETLHVGEASQIQEY